MYIYISKYSNHEPAKKKSNRLDLVQRRDTFLMGRIDFCRTALCNIIIKIDKEKDIIISLILY